MCLSCKSIFCMSYYTIVCILLLLHELVPISILFFFFFQAEDGIRDLVRSRGLGDVYKRQIINKIRRFFMVLHFFNNNTKILKWIKNYMNNILCCLLYTSDAADERSSVDLGGRRIIKKKKIRTIMRCRNDKNNHSNTENQETQY